MSIKYELHAIKNSEGKGNDRKFARIFTNPPIGERQMERTIQNNCSLTEADLRAALVAIGRQMADELKRGNRFHIPEVGYFSLSVALKAGEKDDNRITAGDIRVRSIRFRPEEQLISEVRSGVRFEKSTASSKSREYTAGSLLAAIREFLSSSPCITRRDMTTVFHLRDTTARKWLRKFTEDGLLRREGARNSPVYFLANT